MFLLSNRLNYQFSIRLVHPIWLNNLLKNIKIKKRFNRFVPIQINVLTDFSSNRSHMSYVHSKHRKKN